MLYVKYTQDNGIDQQHHLQSPHGSTPYIMNELSAVALRTPGNRLTVQGAYRRILYESHTLGHLTFSSLDSSMAVSEVSLLFDVGSETGLCESIPVGPRHYASISECASLGSSQISAIGADYASITHDRWYLPNSP